MPRTAFRLRPHRRDDRGAAALEFALIVIPLLMLLTGVIQASTWLWAKQLGAAAAREGARVQAVRPLCTTFPAFLENRAGKAVKTWSTGVAVWTPDPSNTSGSPKVGDTITVTVEFEPVDPVETLWVDFPTVTEVATTRIENVPSTTTACPL